MLSEYVNTIKELKELKVTEVDPDISHSLFVMGYYNPNDGGGGQFLWEKFPLDAAKKPMIPKVDELSLTVITPNEPKLSSVGQWRRILKEPISVKWFGTRGDLKE